MVYFVLKLQAFVATTNLCVQMKIASSIKTKFAMTRTIVVIIQTREDVTVGVGNLTNFVFTMLIKNITLK